MNYLFLLAVVSISLLAEQQGCQSLSLFESSPRRYAILSTLRTAAGILGSSSLLSPANAAIVETDAPKPKFVRYPQLRFIAALGDPKSSNGMGCDQWGLWRDDPGPRGVRLSNADALVKEGAAPAGWKFDSKDWWLEEHGLIMGQPTSLARTKLDKSTKEILPYKRYIVTGDREVTTILTVFENGRWELAKGSLYDVTHLPCRSARYTSSGNSCLPQNANKNQFPVKPGAVMPSVDGCEKQDYAVLFVLGEEA
mmetsp:Transcript_41013/g.46588  ORF Transcript_41013/g.46588 Transcript_41013/m.46588 type:complete len:253 (+) Transcript_41013:94-852(+)|eukprot:CAMPEP_0194186310 /NCGR_PEP_ID=MMETSP0154-20130528/46610_1 /TAXON_ID=1049557 /ORGANISM="Thalassiothrix antarctica, Strain L6-D1" /LENGTH=252 /DNA_ID=CAMNT_0038905295 /DNA_START=8 /DNA_END=766 /DNA_ORIENTATION=+